MCWWRPRARTRCGSPNGGFALVAVVVWCPLLLAATTPGRVAGLLSASWLVAIGARSYGIYLFHWPVITLADSAHLNLTGWRLWTAQLALTAAITEVSYRVVERPIRSGHVFSASPRLATAALTTAAAVGIGALVLPAMTGSPSRMAFVDVPSDAVLFPVTPHPPASSAPSPSGASVGRQVDDVAADSIERAPVPPARRVLLFTAPDGPDLAGRIDELDVPGLELVTLPSSCLTGLTPTATEGSDQPPLTPACRARHGDALAGRDDGASGSPPFDVAVVQLGIEDHERFQAFADERYADGGLVALVPYFRATETRLRQWTTLADTVLIVDDVADDIVGDDAVGVRLEAVDLGEPAMQRIDSADLRDMLTVLLAAGDATTAPGTPVDVLRLMVIGDSTSFRAASGLAQASGHRFEVLWAGAVNCPVVPVVEIKYRLGTAFSVEDCAGTTGAWRDSIATFRPDAIVVVASVTEEILQRYPGDDDFTTPGDDRYVEHHHRALDDLVGLAAPVGAVILVADAPPSPQGTGEWASSDAIVAWNTAITEWDERWTVVGMVDWSRWIVDAESSLGHTIRSDGAHIDERFLQQWVGDPFATSVEARVAELLATTSETGCRTPVDGGWRLDLSRC